MSKDFANPAKRQTLKCNTMSMIARLIIFILFIPSALAAEPAYPPLVPEGERIPNVEFFIQSITALSTVTSVAFSPDGKTLASGLADTTIRLWDVETGKEKVQLSGHTNFVLSVSFSPDGKTLASGAGDKTIRLWDVKTGKEKAQLSGHTDSVNSICFSPDGQTLASGSSDKTIRLWDVKTGKETMQLSGHNSSVICLSFSPDGKTLASGAFEKTIRLWDAATGAEKVKISWTKERYEPMISNQTDYVLSVIFSPDGKTLVSGSSDNIIRLWDVETGKEKSHLEGRAVSQRVSFSPDGKTLASGAFDKTIRLWDVETRKETAQLFGHMADVTNVSFSPDGKMLASGSMDGTIRLWNVETAKEKAQFSVHTSDVNSVSFSPDGKTLASGAWDNTIRLWDVETGKETFQLSGHTSPVSSVSFSFDGKFLTSGAWDNTIRLWDAETGKEKATLSGHTAFINSVSFSPDGKAMASGSMDGTIRLWDAEAGEEKARFSGHTDSVLSVNFSPDGKILASGGAWEKSIRLWDVETGKEKAHLSGHKDGVNSVSFSPDGKTLASGSSDMTIRLWDIETGKETAQLFGHTASVNSVCFSPDGKIIASGSYDMTIRLWDVETGKEKTQLSGHASFVKSVSFSPDGKTLASGSYDNTIRLWNTRTGKCEKILLGGQNGTWLSYNRETDRLLRYDDGTFLTELKGNLRTPVPPPVPDRDGKLVVIQKPEAIVTHDGPLTDFSIEIQNNGLGNLYWVRIDPMIVPYSKENPIDPIVFHSPRVHAVLKPNETVTLSCRVSAFSGRMNPNEQTASLNLKVSSHFTKPEFATIPVHVRLPVIEAKSAILEEQEKRTLIVSLKNKGGDGLDKGIECNAVIDGKSLQRVGLDSLAASETTDISFIVPEDIPISEKTRLNLRVVKSDFPIREWVFPEMPVTLPVPPWYLYAGLALLIMVLGFVIYRVRVYYHPLVITLSQAPDTLKTLDIRELNRAKKFLINVRRLETVLTAAAVHQKWLDSAISFTDLMDPSKKCGLICARLGIRFSPVPNTPYPAFTLRMNPDFSLNIVECLAVFPPDDIPGTDVLAALKGVGGIRKTCLLITTHAALQADLRKQTFDPTNGFVTPDFRELTALLLSPEPEQELARIISRQIEVMQISPYKTGGGVERESIFFGRTRILSHIMNREPANYLIVGGRQLGKSTVLKALERRYKSDPQIDCRYLVLHGADIEYNLAEHAGLPEHASVTDILNRLRLDKTGRRRLFLIDEADTFIRQEAATGYKILHQLRSLSETGNCHFILAGFWELYRTVTLEYQSPIKNFGEMIVIGALEPEACRNLAVNPMELLNIRYESHELVDWMIQETGGRANLIALTCNEMLRNLDKSERTLREADVKKGLESDSVQNALSGWEGITGNEGLDRMDRIVVYAGIILEQFTIEDLTKFLDTSGYTYQPQHLRESLLRLELAFVLKKEQGIWSFSVPLFVKMIRQWNPERMLAGEIA